MRISGLAILLLSLILGCAAAPYVKSEPLEETQEVPAAVESFRDLVTNLLVHYVSLKSGLKLEGNEVQKEGIELVSSKDSDRVVLIVDALELSSQDVLSQPVRAELTLVLKVINEKGDIKYEGRKSGAHESFIDGFMETDAKKRVADILVKDALKQFVNDPEFKKIMAKHKYGTLGSIVSIF